MEIIILPYSIEAMTNCNALKIKHVVRNQLVVALSRRAYSKTLIYTAVLKFSFPINLYSLVFFLYLGFLVKIWQIGGSSPWFVPKKYLTRWPVSLELTRLSQSSMSALGKVISPVWDSGPPPLPFSVITTNRGTFRACQSVLEPQWA